MKQHILAAIGVCLALFAQGQTATNTGLLGAHSYPVDLNDVWGYADGQGNEYALVGVQNGFSVVNVTDPTNLVEEFFIPGSPSVWRDIKTWDHYAYVMHDQTPGTNQGLLIVDMDSIANPTYQYVYPKYLVNDTIVADSATRSHNLWIDENGKLYIFGSDVALGGALIYDVATNPWNPAYLGNFNANYLHDGYARGDTLYGAGLNNGLIITDVSNAKQIQFLAQFNTPGNFAHNCWLSDNGRVLFTTDEVSSGYIAAYDVSDFSNISRTDRFRITPNNQTIPHNAHVMGRHVFTSYYTYGLQILDAKDPSWLLEVGHYDTSPHLGNGFHGAWGAYPFLPSGNILVTDIEQGLFVIHYDGVTASRLYASVVDSLTGTPLPGAKVILNVSADTVALDPIDASFKRFQMGAFTDTIEINFSGYRTIYKPVQYVNGMMDTVVFQMVPFDFSVGESKMNAVISPNPVVDRMKVQVDHPLEDAVLSIIDVAGRTVQTVRWMSNQTEMEFSLDLPSGSYTLQIHGEANVFYSEKIIVR